MRIPERVRTFLQISQWLAIAVGHASCSCEDSGGLEGDTCLDSPGACSGHGECVSKSSSGFLACACDPGWTGVLCDSCAAGFHLEHDTGALQMIEAPPIDGESSRATVRPTNWANYACAVDQKCTADSCSGNGECASTEGILACRCTTGYAGANCAECAAGYQFDVTTGSCALTAGCRDYFCSGHGNCQDGARRADIACSCDTGFGGEFCETCADGYHGVDGRCDANEVCTSDSCSDHGTCDDTSGAVACACDVNYFGPDCSETCTGQTCNDRGTCSITDERALCTCTAGYTSESYCATCAPGLTEVTGLCLLSGACTDDSCNSHGACEQIGGTAVCTCDTGYTGASCYDCAAGFHAAGTDCVADEACGSTSCGAHGACTVVAGTVRCDCDAGWYGEDCEIANPPTRITLAGADVSVEPGETLELTPTLTGIGDFDTTLDWQVVSGGGTVDVDSSGVITYTPDAESIEGTLRQIVLQHDNGTTQWQFGLTVVPPDGVPLTGTSAVGLEAIDQAIADFMVARCTGAVTFGLNWYGHPIVRRGYGRVDGESSPGYNGNCGGAVAGAALVRPDTPMRIGSNSKPVTGVILHDIVRAKMLLAGRLEPWNPNQETQEEWRINADEAVEEVRLLDAELDLVPSLLREILGSCEYDKVDEYSCTAGATMRPHDYSATRDTTIEEDVCEDDEGNKVTCFNGGTCYFGHDGPACLCPDDFTGNRCQDCPLTDNGVDGRWLQVTLGDLLRHRAGLSRSGMDITEVLDGLFDIRQLYDDAWTQTDAAGPFAKTVPDAPADIASDTRVLEDKPLIWDYLLAETGRCLIADPGATSLYSNLGVSLLQLIVEYAWNSTNYATVQNFAGPGDSPLSDFPNTALALFVQQYVVYPDDESPWGATRSQYGLYGGRAVNPYDSLAGQVDPEETVARGVSDGIWYPEVEDESGILCVAAGGGCDWSVGEMNRWLRWETVPFAHGGRSNGPGVGGIITEAELYLRFMEQFYVGTPYGQVRSNWSSAKAHTGEVTGGRAVVRQVGRKYLTDGCTHASDECDPDDESHACCPSGYECINQNQGNPECTASHKASCNECVKLIAYSFPIIDANTGDFTEFEEEPRSCVLPNGLDYFVAVNQTNDANDEEGGDYDAIDAFVLDGLCRVDFPSNSMTFWPETNFAVQFAPNFP